MKENKDTCDQCGKHAGFETAPGGDKCDRCEEWICPDCVGEIEGEDTIICKKCLGGES